MRRFCVWQVVKLESQGLLCPHNLEYLAAGEILVSFHGQCCQNGQILDCEFPFMRLPEDSQLTLSLKRRYNAQWIFHTLSYIFLKLPCGHFFILRVPKSLHSYSFVSLDAVTFYRYLSPSMEELHILPSFTFILPSIYDDSQCENYIETTKLYPKE